MSYQSGFNTNLHERLLDLYGKNNGQMNPGYFCCYCSYKRIAAMITKNAVQFTTPIEEGHPWDRKFASAQQSQSLGGCLWRFQKHRNGAVVFLLALNCGRIFYKAKRVMLRSAEPMMPKCEPQRIGLRSPLPSQPFTPGIIIPMPYIEGCPTKDNVKVSVDIGVTFHIGTEATRKEDCEKFLYMLGANKLEELLQQECEETIRNYIRMIKVSKIRDIKSELTSTLMADLNTRFNSYGVYIEKVNVMNVVIPRDLRYALQTATTYDVLLQQQVKFQEYTIIRMINENDKAMLILKRANQMKMNELTHQLAMEEIGLEKIKVQTETDQKVAIIKAQEKQSIRKQIIFRQIHLGPKAYEQLILGV